MAEIWDVYDGNGIKTGKTMERGVPAAGEYMLCVHVYLHTPDGRFLVQKRSRTKESHPGVWDITGGAVLKGEESLEGAQRETLEEVGIDISDAAVYYAGRVKKRKSFADVYFAEKSFALSDCVLQEEEVEQVKFVNKEELLEIQGRERKRDARYVEFLKRAMEKYLG